MTWQYFHMTWKSAQLVMGNNLTSLSSCISTLLCAGNLCFLKEALYNSPERKRDIDHINIRLAHLLQTPVQARHISSFKTERSVHGNPVDKQPNRQGLYFKTSAHSSVAAGKFNLTPQGQQFWEKLSGPPPARHTHPSGANGKGLY